jgi:hypothetical protein
MKQSSLSLRAAQALSVNSVTHFLIVEKIFGCMVNGNEG